MIYLLRSSEGGEAVADLDTFLYNQKQTPRMSPSDTCASAPFSIRCLLNVRREGRGGGEPCLDALVLGILGVVLVGHDPLVVGKHAAGFEAPENLREAPNLRQAAHAYSDRVAVETSYGLLQLPQERDFNKISADLVRRVAGGLHGEGAVKGLLLPWLVLEVAAVQLAQVLQALLLVVFVADVHLCRSTGKGGEVVYSDDA